MQKLRNNTLSLAFQLPTVDNSLPHPKQTMTETQGRSIQLRNRAPAGLCNALTRKINPARDTNVNQLLAGHVTIHFHLHTLMDALFLPSQVEGKHSAVSLGVRSRAALGGRGMPVGFMEPGTDIPQHVCQE